MTEKHLTESLQSITRKIGWALQAALAGDNVQRRIHPINCM